MQKEKNNYRLIFKGTALFGGVQVFNILINLVRGKLIAVLLGPEGMGISSLLTSSANTIQQFSGLGLNFSVVKEIAEVKEKGNLAYLSWIIPIIRCLLRSTAIIGACFSVFFSSYLSIWTFGVDDYKWYFVFLSIVVFFTTMSNGELSILQGFHEVRKLALASVVGSVVGLVVGIPLYYMYGYDGILPAMIALSLSTYIFYRFSSRKIDSLLKKNSVLKEEKTWKEKMGITKKILLLGLVLMAASLLGTLTNYLLNTFIGHNGSLVDVGLYQAANSITNQYVGLVFAAMALDFFPRLSAVCTDNDKVKKLVNQQSEIVVLIVAPIAIFVIVAAPLIIKVLLTETFLPLIPVVRLMAVGIFFKAIAFPMGYISFSKGDKRFFFWFEGVWGNCKNLLLNCLFYYYWGIVGIGFSFVISYVIGVLLYVYFTNKLYAFQYESSVLVMIAALGMMLCAAFACSYITNTTISYILMIVILLFAVCYSLYEFNQRVHLLDWKKKE